MAQDNILPHLRDIPSDEASKLVAASVFAAANARVMNPEALHGMPKWVYSVERADSILEELPVPASAPPVSGPSTLQDIVREPQPVAESSAPQDLVREPWPACGSPLSRTPPLPPAFLFGIPQRPDADCEDEMDIDSTLKSQPPPRDASLLVDDPGFPPIVVAGPSHRLAGSSWHSPSSSAGTEQHDQLASPWAATGSSATTVEPQNPFEGDPPPVGEYADYCVSLSWGLTPSHRARLD
jgi:hypothetical protein